MKRLSAVGLLLALSSCASPSPPAPAVKASAEDRAPARTHDFDGRYVGPGTTAAGYTCGSGYNPAQWTAILTINRNRWELTPWAAGGDAPKYHGNVSPGGVLTRYGVLFGRVVDGKFEGEMNMNQTCRHHYNLERVPAAPAD